MKIIFSIGLDLYYLSPFKFLKLTYIFERKYFVNGSHEDFHFWKDKVDNYTICYPVLPRLDYKKHAMKEAKKFLSEMIII